AQRRRLADAHTSPEHKGDEVCDVGALCVVVAGDVGEQGIPLSMGEGSTVVPWSLGALDVGHLSLGYRVGADCAMTDGQPEDASVDRAHRLCRTSTGRLGDLSERPLNSWNVDLSHRQRS